MTFSFFLILFYLHRYRDALHIVYNLRLLPPQSSSDLSSVEKFETLTNDVRRNFSEVSCFFFVVVVVVGLFIFLKLGGGLFHEMFIFTVERSAT